MGPGTALHRIFRLTCTTGRLERVLEPALADLQHDWATSRSRVALLRNYLAVWRSWGTCVLQDAAVPEARSFVATMLVSFALTVMALAVIELALMDASVAVRRQIITAYGGSRAWPITVYARLVFAGMSDTATLRYGVPIAIGPALFYATRRTTRVVPAAYATVTIFAMLVTIASSGWIAPTMVRVEGIRNHDRFADWAAHAPSSSRRGWYVPPLDFSSFSPSKNWPELIRSALEPPKHEFPLMPQYVAPAEQMRPAADRREIVERIVLVLLAFSCGIVGTVIGGLTKRPSANC